MDDWSLEAVLFITMMLVIILMMVVDHDDDDDATCVNCECEPTPEEPGVSICWFGWTGITIIHSDLSEVTLKHLQPTKRTILPPKISTFQTLEISFQPFSSPAALSAAPCVSIMQWAGTTNQTLSSSSLSLPSSSASASSSSSSSVSRLLFFIYILPSRH